MGRALPGFRETDRVKLLSPKADRYAYGGLMAIAAAYLPFRLAGVWQGDHADYDHTLDVVLLAVSIVGMWFTKFVFTEGSFAATTWAYRVFRGSHRVAIIPLFLVVNHDLMLVMNPLNSISITLLAMCAFQAARWLLRAVSPEPDPYAKKPRAKQKKERATIVPDLPASSRRRKKP